MMFDIVETTIDKAFNSLPLATTLSLATILPHATTLRADLNSYLSMNKFSFDQKEKWM